MGSQEDHILFCQLVTSLVTLVKPVEEIKILKFTIFHHLVVLYLVVLLKWVPSVAALGGTSNKENTFRCVVLDGTFFVLLK